MADPDSTSSPPPEPAGAEGVPAEMFVQAYASGEHRELWETGRPQPAFVERLATGDVRGRLLDFGCGTGQTSVAAARSGLEVVGIDIAPAAIELARPKIEDSAITGSLRFELLDLLTVDRPADALGGPFDWVFDAAVFHVFSDAQRPCYEAVMRNVLREGGRLLTIVFSEHQPGGGPRRVTRDELRSTFRRGWREVSLVESRYETASGPKLSWLAEFERS